MDGFALLDHFSACECPFIPAAEFEYEGLFIALRNRSVADDAMLDEWSAAQTQIKQKNDAKAIQWLIRDRVFAQFVVDAAKSTPLIMERCTAVVQLQTALANSRGIDFLPWVFRDHCKVMKWLNSIPIYVGATAAKDFAKIDAAQRRLTVLKCINERSAW